MWQKRHRTRSTVPTTAHSQVRPRYKTVDTLSFWTYNRVNKESKVKIIIKLPKKHREHFVLFAENTPFKPKVVQSKKQFKRNPKHKGRDE